MKIGFLLPSIYMYQRFGEGRIFAPGDLGRILVDGLVKKGHEVYFYTAPKVKTLANLVPGDESLLSEDPTYYLFRNRSKEEQEYSIAEIRKRDFEYHLTLKAYKDALLGKLNIIHCYHDFGGHYFNELTKFPTIYTLHDPMPKVGTIEYLRFYKFLNHKYISISNNQRNHFPLNFIKTVYHGVDMKEYEMGSGEDGYLAYFGRILEDKGVDLAIEVAKQTKLSLKIATSVIKANLSQKYYDEKIKPNIDGKFISEIGILKGKEKADYIGRAKVFILPLRWEEPFGLVMVEAMACGTPVIAFARGSVPEIIKDGETGFIVNMSGADIRGNWIIKKTGTEGLCEAVERIYSMSSNKYNKMRKNCREHVKNNFTVEKMVEGYEKVYEEVLNRKI